MSTKKTAGPPPQNRGSNGRFITGNRANPGGRVQKIPEIKEFCRSESMTGIKRLAELRDLAETRTSDVVAIVRLMLEYGYGRPAAELDRERLELDTKRLQIEQQRADVATSAGPSVVTIEWNGAEELAK